MADTGFKAPTANEDEGSTEWVNRNNLHADDTSATTGNTGNNGISTSRWKNFTFGVPAGATIDGIEGTIRGYDAFGDAGWYLNLYLSYDGGTSWTSAKRVPASGDFGGTPGSKQTWTFGGSADTWGRSWDASEFSDANFKIRIAYQGDNYTEDASLEYLALKVYYTEGGTTPNEYSHVGSGGLILGGAATRLHEKPVVGVGGMVLGGAATRLHEKPVVGVGGMVLGGAALKEYEPNVPGLTGGGYLPLPRRRRR